MAQTEISIEFRPCTPADVAEVVPLIYSSGPDAFSYVFQTQKVGAQDFLSYAFQREGGEFSFDNHQALLVNGELVGVGAVFSGKQASGFTVRDFLNILGFYRWRALPILIRGLRTEQIIKLPKKREICIGHLGIASSHRGIGLGTRLIYHLMRVAIPQPDDTFILDVSVENPNAQALYERLGFQVVKRETSSLKNPYGHVADHLRMRHFPKNG